MITMICHASPSREMEELAWEQSCYWELLFLLFITRNTNICVCFCGNSTDLKISLDFVIWRKLVLKILSHYTVGTVVQQFHLLILFQEWSLLAGLRFLCLCFFYVSFICYSLLPLPKYYLDTPHRICSY